MGSGRRGGPDSMNVTIIKTAYLSLFLRPEVIESNHRIYCSS